MKGYNERGLATVLRGVVDLVNRAADCLDKCNPPTPPVMQSAYRKQVATTLTDAEELLAAVRKEARL